MAKLITLKYDGVCRKCGEEIPAGSKAHWARGAGVWCQGGCDSADVNPDPEIAQAHREQARMDSEYNAGVADANRYLDDKRFYGEELADQWEMDAELARFNRGDDY